MGISDNPAWDFDWPGHRYLSEEQIWECTLQGWHAPGVAPSVYWGACAWAELKEDEVPKYPAYPDYFASSRSITALDSSPYSDNDAFYRYDANAEVWVSEPPWTGLIKHIFRSGRHGSSGDSYVAESEWTQWVPTREWGEYLAEKLSEKVGGQFYVRLEKNILLAEQKMDIFHVDISHDYVNYPPAQYWRYGLPLATTLEDALIEHAADLESVNEGGYAVDLRSVQALVQRARTHLLRRRTTHLPSISLAWKVTTVTPSEEKIETAMEDAMWLNLNRPFLYSSTRGKQSVWDSSPGTEDNMSYGEPGERRYALDSTGRMYFVPWRNLVVPNKDMVEGYEEPKRQKIVYLEEDWGDYYLGPDYDVEWDDYDGLGGEPRHETTTESIEGVDVWTSEWDDMMKEEGLDDWWEGAFRDKD